MPPGPYRAVLFDLDGVLIDSYEVWFHLMNAASVEYGVSAISRETFRKCWGQGIQADVRVFFTEQSIEELEVFYESHFMDFAEHLVLETEAPAVFVWLREHGMPIAVITNTPAELARKILAHARLAPDALVGGTDVVRAKPAPDMVLRGCELLGVVPASALVVGDSSFDREAAGAAGVSFAGLGIKGDFDLDRLTDLLEIFDGERVSRAARFS